MTISKIEDEMSSKNKKIAKFRYLFNRIAKLFFQLLELEKQVNYLF